MDSCPVSRKYCFLEDVYRDDKLFTHRCCYLRDDPKRFFVCSTHYLKSTDDLTDSIQKCEAALFVDVDHPSLSTYVETIASKNAVSIICEDHREEMETVSSYRETYLEVTHFSFRCMAAMQKLMELAHFLEFRKITFDLREDYSVLLQPVSGGFIKNVLVHRFCLSPKDPSPERCEPQPLCSDPMFLQLARFSFNLLTGSPLDTALVGYVNKKIVLFHGFQAIRLEKELQFVAALLNETSFRFESVAKTALMKDSRTWLQYGDVEDSDAEFLEYESDAAAGPEDYFQRRRSSKSKLPNFSNELFAFAHDMEQKAGKPGVAEDSMESQGVPRDAFEGDFEDGHAEFAEYESDAAAGLEGYFQRPRPSKSLSKSVKLPNRFANVRDMTQKARKPDAADDSMESQGVPRDEFEGDAEIAEYESVTAAGLEGHFQRPRPKALKLPSCFAQDHDMKQKTRKPDAADDSMESQLLSTDANVSEHMFFDKASSSLVHSIYGGAVSSFSQTLDGAGNDSKRDAVAAEDSEGQASATIQLSASIGKTSEKSVAGTFDSAAASSASLAVADKVNGRSIHQVLSSEDKVGMREAAAAVAVDSEVPTSPIFAAEDNASKRDVAGDSEEANDATSQSSPNTDGKRQDDATERSDVTEHLSDDEDSQSHRKMNTFAQAFRLTACQLKMLGKMVCTVVVVLSPLIYFAEKDEPSTPITSLSAAFWYVLVTMATVGFGASPPQTSLGRVIGAAVIMIGAIFLALPFQFFTDNLTRLEKAARPTCLCCPVHSLHRKSCPTRPPRGSTPPSPRLPRSQRTTTTTTVVESVSTF